MSARRPRTEPAWLAGPWWATAATGLLGWVVIARGDMGPGVTIALGSAAAYAVIALWPRPVKPFGPAIRWWLLLQLVLGWACFPLTLGGRHIDWTWFGVVAAIAGGGGLIVFLLVGLGIVMLVVPIVILRGGDPDPARASAAPGPPTLSQRMALAAIVPCILAAAITVQFGVMPAPGTPDQPTRAEAILQMLAIVGLLDPRLVITSDLWLWTARLSSAGAVVAVWWWVRVGQRSPAGELRLVLWGRDRVLPTGRASGQAA